VLVDEIAFGTSLVRSGFTALPDGGFIASYSSSGGAGTLQFFDEFGSATTEIISLGAPTGECGRGYADIAVLDNGLIAAMWHSGGGKAVLLNAQGDVVSDVIDIPFSVYTPDYDNAIALSDSKLLFHNSFDQAQTYLANAIAEGTIQITRDLLVGEIVSSVITLEDEDGLNEQFLQYQWYIDGDIDEAISGATEATLTLTSATAGKGVYLVTSVADLNGIVSTFTSETTGVITNVVRGDSDDNELTGTALDEFIFGEAGQDTILAFSGDDTLYGGAGDDSINGAGNNDLILGEDGSDVLRGGADADKIYGGADADSLYGDAGKDLLFGGTDADLLDGGSENDKLRGGDGEDILIGVSGKDKLFRDDGADDLSGGDQNDRLFGKSGDDSLSGDDGKDRLFGGTGNDTMSGGAKNDRLSGDAGSDTLLGDAGKDRLSGGDAADYLDGGKHNDTLTGGDGADTFAFDRAVRGRDVITDLSADDTLIFYRKGAEMNVDDTDAFIASFATVTDDGVKFSFGGKKTLLLQDVDTLDELTEIVSFDYM
jgi:Ca2+-binding RTX toxin-like protein